MNNRTRDVVWTLARADSALSYLLWSGLVSELVVGTMYLWLLNKQVSIQECSQSTTGISLLTKVCYKSVLR
jgi:hypothetical protein